MLHDLMLAFLCYVDLGLFITGITGLVLETSEKL